MRLLGLVFCAALSGTLPVAAQPANPPPSPVPAAPTTPAPLTVTPPTPAMVARRLARRAARVDRDIATLRAGLQLTPAQESLWPPVAAAVHDLDTARGFRFRQAMAAAPSTVDALKMQGDHMAAMGVAIGRLADATKPLVATLSPDQKSRLPGLLQDVRLPKVMSRALELPQDSAGASWGIGDQGGSAAAGQRAAQSTPGAAAPAAVPGAGAAVAPKPGQDDEE